jgi:hypothetical protein
MIKLVVAHNSLRLIHLIGLWKRVNVQLIDMQIYADIIKSSGLDLFMSLSHEFPSLDDKFYENANKPINQNANFVIERLEYASNRLIFDLYNQ